MSTLICIAVFTGITAVMSIIGVLLLCVGIAILNDDEAPPIDETVARTMYS